ncbi:unnamed protein product [Dovyalis caffra]|uniref:Uncharacterized protein n=1 Tax=Dovyalis caffra TaxID=77055 RepID=A0AAV1S7S1_9ROSI|nr:unnamed protein product [Dovyalis caffra]
MLGVERWRGIIMGRWRLLESGVEETTAKRFNRIKEIIREEEEVAMRVDGVGEGESRDTSNSNWLVPTQLRSDHNVQTPLFQCYNSRYQKNR